MTIALQRAWTTDAFLAWAATQEEPYEFDGFEPLPMNGGTANHNAIGINLLTSLRAALRGTSCRVLGPTMGIRTLGDAVRFPDALVTCAPIDGAAQLIPAPVIVFEVVSPTSSRTDRLTKVREYAAVPSIRRYVIVESTSITLTVLGRDDATRPWTATALGETDILHLPEIQSETQPGTGIGLPVADIYLDVTFSAVPPVPG